jgi:hypothetical protein
VIYFSKLLKILSDDETPFYKKKNLSISSALPQEYRLTSVEYNCYLGFTGDTGSHSLSVCYISLV